MAKVFNGAFFGEWFHTKDNRKAVYLGNNFLVIEGYINPTEYNDDGIPIKEYPHEYHGEEIDRRWETKDGFLDEV